MIDKIIKELKLMNAGNRSFTSNILKIMREHNAEDLVASELIDIIIVAEDKDIPLTATCKKITTNLSKMFNLHLNDIKDVGLIRSGTHFLDAVAKAGLIDVEKDKNSDKEYWKLVIIDKDLEAYQDENLPLDQLIDPTLGKQVWERPYLYLNGKKAVSIVKKMDRFKMGNYYTKAKMPMVYRVLNKLGAVEYQINHYILELALQDAGFCPQQLPEDAPSWIKNNVPIKSKRKEFDSILKYAQDWKDYALNFTYNCDSRGRVYSLQTYLHPQGNDLAKALLLFNNPKQINPDNLMIHTANCFGQDKGTYAERIKWVYDNWDALYTIACDPWNNMDLISELGLYVNENEQEKKSKWLALAAINELARWFDAGQPEEFLSNLPVARDASSSGSQVYSMWSRDEVAAPFVNIQPTTDGKPGDLYMYTWNTAMLPLLPTYKSHKDWTPLMDDILKEIGLNSGTGRKLVKRQQMCANYGATRYGMTDMYLQDKKEMGSELIAQIGVKEANVLGHCAYEACDIALSGAKKLKKYFQDGLDIKFKTNPDAGAIVKWTMRSGFTAFIAKDKSKEGTITATIGKRDIALTYYVWKDKANKVRLKNAFNPSRVHAEDALILMEIVDNFDGDIMVIHDSYSCVSSEVDQMVKVAKEAYLKSSNRDELKDTCTEVFGIERELPQEGKWSTDGINQSEYIIC